MKISLDKIARREIDKIDLNFSQKIDTINYCDSSYDLTSPISVEGKVSNTNKGLYLDVNVSFTMLDNCSRCLENVEEKVDYEIQGFLVKENYDEDSFEDYDAYIYEGDELNLLDIIEQTLDFNISRQTLCNEDCKGICPGCGVDLNKLECSCNNDANDEEIIDPRFAKLKDIFKND